MGPLLLPARILSLFNNRKLLITIQSKLLQGGAYLDLRRKRFGLIIDGYIGSKTGPILIHKSLNALQQYRLYCGQVTDMFSNRPETAAPALVHFVGRNGLYKCRQNIRRPPQSFQ
jgi:hypothetical protein